MCCTIELSLTFLTNKKKKKLHFEKKVDNLGFGSTVNTLCRTVAHFYEALLQCSIYVEQRLLGM